MGSYNYNIGLAKETAKRKHTFKDIAVPVSKDKSNYDLSQNVDLDSIKQCITNILDWDRGERILNPEFGNMLKPYMYESISPETAGRIANSLMASLESWEPRIAIESINVQPREDLNEYHVELIYSIPSLGITNLTYPAIFSN